MSCRHSSLAKLAEECTDFSSVASISQPFQYRGTSRAVEKDVRCSVPIGCEYWISLGFDRIVNIWNSQERLLEIGHWGCKVEKTLHKSFHNHHSLLILGKPNLPPLLGRRSNEAPPLKLFCLICKHLLCNFPHFKVYDTTIDGIKVQ
jgi:hypothetical protein